MGSPTKNSNVNGKGDEPANDSFNQEYDNVLDELNNMGHSMSSVARSIMNITSDSLLSLLEKTKDYALQLQEDHKKWYDDHQKWHQEHQTRVDELFNRRNDPQQRLWFDETDDDISVFFPKPYQDRDPDTVRNKRRGCWKRHHHESPSPFWLPRKGVTPFGLFSLNNPSERAYNECVAKDGESLWELNGYWRCLFPNNVVPPALLNAKVNERALQDKILTKEDYNEALTASGLTGTEKVIDLGTKGIFFRQFTDYLDWQRTMKQNVLNERRQKIKEVGLDRQNGVDEELKKDVVVADTSARSDKLDKSVTSYSISSSYLSDNEGAIMKEVRKEQYNDGTWNTTTTVKRKPMDSDQWIVEQDDTKREAKKGWFWTGTGTDTGSDSK